MRLSVVVPMYNAAAFLTDCLAMLRAQAITDYEVICVDDGSTDGTGALLDAAAAEDARLRVLHQPNGGVSMARNAGIDAARGDYVTFVDADDALLPNAFAKLLEAAPEMDIVTADHWLLDAQGAETLMHCPPEARRADIVAALVGCDGRYNAVWGKLYRRAFLLQRGLRLPPGIKIGEDVLFNLRAFAVAQRWAHVQLPLYRYRLSPSSAMGRAEADALAAHQPMLDAMDDFLRGYGKAPFYRDFLGLHVGLLPWAQTKAPTLDRRARGRINRGVNPAQLGWRHRLLWLALACGCSAPVCRRLGSGVQAHLP